MESCTVNRGLDEQYPVLMRVDDSSCFSAARVDTAHEHRSASLKNGMMEFAQAGKLHQNFTLVNILEATKRRKKTADRLYINPKLVRPK